MNQNITSFPFSPLPYPSTASANPQYTSCPRRPHQMLTEIIRPQSSRDLIHKHNNRFSSLFTFSASFFPPPPPPLLSNRTFRPTATIPSHTHFQPLVLLFPIVARALSVVCMCIKHAKFCRSDSPMGRTDTCVRSGAVAARAYMAPGIAPTDPFLSVMSVCKRFLFCPCGALGDGDGCVMVEMRYSPERGKCLSALAMWSGGFGQWNGRALSPSTCSPPQLRG